MIAEPPIVHDARRVLGWWRLAVVGLVVAGAGAIVAGAYVRGWAGLAIGGVLAIFLWSGAAYLHLTWLAVPQPEKRTHLVDTSEGLELHVGLRPHLPLAMLVGGIGMTVFFGFLTFWMESTWWLVVGGLCALLGLLPIPDAIRALTSSDRGAIIDAQGIAYNGYSYETRVAWDAVASGDIDRSNRRMITMMLVLRPGQTMTWTRRRWIAHFEPPPESTRFKIPAIVFDQPWNVLAVCTGIAETPPDHRPGYLANVGRTLLEDPTVPRGL